MHKNIFLWRLEEQVAIVMSFPLCPEAKYGRKSQSTYKHPLRFWKPHVYIKQFEFLTSSPLKRKRQLLLRCKRGHYGMRPPQKRCLFLSLLLLIVDTQEGRAQEMTLHIDGSRWLHLSYCNSLLIQFHVIYVVISNYIVSYTKPGHKVVVIVQSISVMP